MSRLDTNKLFVEFRDPITMTEPILYRRYTLTHSDITAELLLTIALCYAYDRINEMRDEVLGEWILQEGDYLYYVYLYVDGEYSDAIAATRDFVFRRELPLALEAIRYGDREFFKAHPEMDNAPIIVVFMSTNPRYNKTENWGTFVNYMSNYR